MAKRSTPGHRSPKQSQRTKDKKTKPKYKVRNWHEYNEALGRRGELTVWVDPDVPERWYVVFPPPRRDNRGRKPRPQGPDHRGRPQHYSDFAIRVMLQFSMVYHQPLRQTEHMMQVIFGLLHLSLTVPDYTTLCRRQKGLDVPLRRRRAAGGGGATVPPPPGEEPLHVLIDATGLKVYGDGEWKVRLKRGWSLYRSWRKLHLLALPTGEIRVARLETSHKTDDAMVEPLLEQEPETMASFTGDGGYDKLHVYDTLIQRRVPTMTIPPRSNAKIHRHGNRKDLPPYPRDDHIRRVRQVGIKRWKQETGYHRRSKIENVFFRFKTIFGHKLRMRLLEHQQAEALIKVCALNRMMDLGMPESYKCP